MNATTTSKTRYTKEQSKIDFKARLTRQRTQEPKRQSQLVEAKCGILWSGK